MDNQNWDSAPEDKQRERPAPAQGIGRFLRENGGWLVAIGGLIAMFFGGVNLGTLAMIAVGGMAVAAAKAAGPNEEEARDRAEGIPQGARYRERSNSRGNELEFETVSDRNPSRSNERELEFALARDRDNRSEETSDELNFVTPPRTPAQSRSSSNELSF